MTAERTGAGTRQVALRVGAADDLPGDGGCEMRQAGVAAHHERGTSHQVGEPHQVRAPGEHLLAGQPGGRRDPVREQQLRGEPVTTTRCPLRSSSTATAAKRSAGQRLAP